MTTHAADPRIDAYIAAAPAYARPILKHLRAVIHEGCPGVEETIKWSHPSFVYAGKILCGAAAFKTYIRFGFWQSDVAAHVARKFGYDKTEEGRFGRIANLADLPDRAVLLDVIADAARLHDAARAAPKKPRAVGKPARKPEIPVPPDFARRLRCHPTAAATLEKLPPSHRREYFEWITGAKRAETREKRMATSIEWLAQGKSLNWKYQPVRA